METHVRRATAADAGAIARIYAPYVDASYVSFEEIAPSEDELRAKIDGVGSAFFPWLVCEMRGEIAGYAYASRHRARAAYRWSVDVGTYVRPDAQRCGVGARLYRALLALLTMQGYRMAYAGIVIPNPASIALHRKVGFTSIGRYRNVGFKAGAWRDTEWFERELASPTAEPPPEPVPLHLLDPMGIERALA